jgi:hypothetical protein
MDTAVAQQQHPDTATASALAQPIKNILKLHITFYTVVRQINK